LKKAYALGIGQVKTVIALMKRVVIPHERLILT